MERGKKGERFEKQDIFFTLVKYHTEHNLINLCLPNVEDGRVVNRNKSNRPYNEGSENKNYEGLVIFADGSTLADTLRRDDIFKAEPEPFWRVRTSQEFLENILLREEKDGAHVYDSVNGQQTHCVSFKNTSKSSPQTDVLAMVPCDFIDKEGKLHSPDMFGNRTRLAMDLPRSYDNVDSYQIKTSAYGEFGMGKVVHFNQQGLVEEFFFEYDKEPSTGSDEPRDRIQGVYRRYERDTDRELVKVVEQRFGLDEIGLIKDICYKLPKNTEDQREYAPLSQTYAQCA